MNIAVVIPSHNRAHTLSRCLDSVLSQTLLPTEIIVVDDGSTDATRQLLTEQYPDIHYLQQANQGVSAARNAGIAATRSDWVALLDSDDEWLPQKLAWQTQALTKSGLSVCHGEEIWIRHGVRVNQMKKHRKQGGDIFVDSLRMCAMSPSSIVLQRDLLQHYSGFDEQFPVCEDYDLWLQITSEHRVTYVEQAVIKKYGGHEDQLSRRYFAMDKYRIMAIQKLLQANRLSAEQQQQALEMMLHKLAILEKGARKHANQALLDFCRAARQFDE